jgi:hypothetical protein
MGSAGKKGWEEYSILRREATNGGSFGVAMKWDLWS